MSSIVAFTTAPAVRPLYRRDALNAIAYLDSWYLRLTYRGQWISPTVKELLKSGALDGRDLLIVLCGSAAGAGTPAPPTFLRVVPLRFEIIRNPRIEGDLDQKGFAELPVELRKRPSMSLFRSLSANLQANVPRLGDPGAKWVIQVEDVVPGGGEEMDWDEHVEEVLRISELANCHFSRMVSFSRRDPSQSATATSLDTKNADVTLIELTAGCAYELKFNVHSESLRRETGVPVAIAIQGKHVEVAEPVVYQCGSGAIVTYLLAVERKYAAETATLSARRRLDRKEINVGEEGPEFQVILRIRPPWYFWVSAIAMLTLGAMGLNLKPESLRGLARFLRLVGLGSIVNLAQPLGADLASLLANAAGSLLLALAAGFAFRRLPVKV